MAELSQEELINYVALAIEALKPTLGHRMLIKDIQTYLKEHYNIDESMERIKEAEDIINELEDERTYREHQYEGGE
jgi:uncharacterized protein YqgV (UPF0045/DUF77 family)